jgi:hypothetical protein
MPHGPRLLAAVVEQALLISPEDGVNVRQL